MTGAKPPRASSSERSPAPDGRSSTTRARTGTLIFECENYRRRGRPRLLSSASLPRGEGQVPASGADVAEDREGDGLDAVQDELDADDRGDQTHDLGDDPLSGLADSRDQRGGREQDDERQE